MTQATGSYGELLKLTNSSYTSNSGERTYERKMTRPGGGGWRGDGRARKTERNREFGTKFRHCEMTRVVFIAATPAERDVAALSASSSFFRGVLTKVSVGLSASRSFVAPFSDITAPPRPLGAL